MKNRDTKPNSKTTTTYKLSPKVLDTIEAMRLKDYPSVSFPAFVELLASKQLARLSDDDFASMKRIPRGLSFTREFRNELEAIAKKNKGVNPLNISAILNRLLELSLSRNIQ